MVVVGVRKHCHLAGMIDKPHPAGWVVQVTTPGLPSLTRSASGLFSRVLGAPSFKYFNVALAAPEKAIEATRKHLSQLDDEEVSTVRRLSLGEIAALGLASGEVKPA